MRRGAGSKGAGSGAGSGAGVRAAAGSSGSGLHGVDSGVEEYDIMSDDEQPQDSAANAGLEGVVKRTRVEGR